MRNIVFILAIAFATVSMAQTKNKNVNPSRKKIAIRATPINDRNTRIRDSLIQENSDFYKILYTKPISEKVIDNTGLTYKLMAVRNAKTKDGGIAVSLLVENLQQDDSVVFHYESDLLYYPSIYFHDKTIFSYSISNYLGNKPIKICKGVRYLFEIVFKTTHTPEHLEHLRIPDGSHTKTLIDFTDVKIDWEGENEQILYNTENKSLETLKKDNEDFRKELGYNNCQLSYKDSNMEYNIIKAVGKIKDDWEYDDLRIRKFPIKKMNIVVTMSINNKGSYKRIVFSQSPLPFMKDQLYIILSDGKKIDNNSSYTTRSERDHIASDYLYNLNSNSIRNIDIGFSSKGENRPRIIQLLHIYEENSGKVLEFKNIPISWE